MKRLLRDTLPGGSEKLGLKKLAEHAIEVGGHAPIRQCCYAVSPPVQAAIREAVDDRLTDGVNEQDPVLVAEGEECPETADRWYRAQFEAVVQEPEKNPGWQVKEGQLYIQRAGRGVPDSVEDLDRWKLVLPVERRIEALRESHDDPQAGHLGREKTYQRAAVAYYWPRMYKDVAIYVRECTTCQKAKGRAAHGRGKGREARRIRYRNRDRAAHGRVTNREARRIRLRKVNERVARRLSIVHQQQASRCKLRERPGTVAGEYLVVRRQRVLSSAVDATTRVAPKLAGTVIVRKKLSPQHRPAGRRQWARRRKTYVKDPELFVRGIPGHFKDCFRESRNNDSGCFLEGCGEVNTRPRAWVECLAGYQPLFPERQVNPSAQNQKGPARAKAAAQRMKRKATGGGFRRPRSGLSPETRESGLKQGLSQQHGYARQRVRRRRQLAAPGMRAVIPGQQPRGQESRIYQG